MNLPRRRVTTTSALLTLVVVVGLLLRLLALGTKSLWQDEGTSVYYAQLPLQTLLWSLCDPHPPGYYMVLRAALAFGRSEWWVRLPSALSGALVVLLTYVQARVMLAPLSGAAPTRISLAALLAAGLVAVAPMHVWYSQEARPYALLTAAALVMTTAGTWWWRSPGLARGMAYVLTSWLAFSVEYGVLAAWFLLNLLLLSGWPWSTRTRSHAVARQRTVWWLILQVLAFAPFVVWWRSSAQGLALTRPSYHAVFLAVQARAAGLGLTPDGAKWIVTGALLLALLAGVAIALATRRDASQRNAAPSWLERPWAAALLAGLLMLLAIWGVAPRLYTLKRHLVVFIPYIAIATGWALTSPAWRRLKLARAVLPGLLAACLVLSLAAVLLIPKSSWREAARVLANVARPGDAIWVDEMGAPVFNYYWQDWLPWQPLLVNEREALNATPATQRVWLAGDVSPYRDIYTILPARFAASRVVVEQFMLPGLAARAYDAGAPIAPMSVPTDALIWGMMVPSPLQTDCRQP